MTSVWRLIQDKKNEDREQAIRQSLSLALSCPLSGFLQGLGFHFKKYTKFPSSFCKKQASAAETNRSLYQCC